MSTLILLRRVIVLISKNRQKGQTSRLISNALNGEALLVLSTYDQVSNAHRTIQLATGLTAAGGTPLQAVSLSQVPTQDYPGGVVFDNHAVLSLAAQAMELIERLEGQVRSLQNDNSLLEQDLGREKAKSKELLDRLEEVTGEGVNQ